ncbi:hypothetical protein [Nocardioides sp. SYSU D00065]|uniref:hypothetical protein n=1 Tax=Nocardioides sp. SYSU D00065 TaxID=2817378 RepID=UPI001B322BBB|nr:hypothetical protein [Nocardioides sp. SYSU D00065]
MWRTLLVPAALTLSLAACSGSGPGAGAPASPGTATARTVGTEPGTDLELGQSAVLVWQPAADVTGELELSVDEVAEQRRSVLDGWTRDDAMAASRPYFVTVTLANVGEADLGGQDVPLYLRDTDGALGAPWTVGGDFRACQSGPLPSPFEPDAEAAMCLVYLVPEGGRVRDMVFQPTEGFDPITWSGDVREPRRRGED